MNEIAPIYKHLQKKIISFMSVLKNGKSACTDRIYATRKGKKEILHSRTAPMLIGEKNNACYLAQLNKGRKVWVSLKDFIKK